MVENRVFYGNSLITHGVYRNTGLRDTPLLRDLRWKFRIFTKIQISN